MGRWFVRGALEQTGEEVSGTFTADSESDAASQARQAGMLVSEVKPAVAIPLDYRTPPRPSPGRLPLEPGGDWFARVSDAVFTGLVNLLLAGAMLFFLVMIILGLGGMWARSDLEGIRGLLSMLVGLVGVIGLMLFSRGRHAK